jgi:hypothetical protein
MGLRASTLPGPEMLQAAGAVFFTFFYKNYGFLINL